VAEISGKRVDDRVSQWKSRKGFRYHVKNSRVRPSNTSVGDLVLSDCYVEVVLRFIRTTRVGMIKAGAVGRAQGRA